MFRYTKKIVTVASVLAFYSGQLYAMDPNQAIIEGEQPKRIGFVAFRETSDQRFRNGFPKAIDMEVLLERYVKGKKVLDIGTGNGKKAKLMKEMGAESVLGIEPNEQACMLAKEELGDNHVLNKSVQDLTTDYHEQFDLITIINFNISFKAIPSVAEKVEKLLKPGGKLIIGIHDEEYINDQEYFFGVFKKHLTYFGGIQLNIRSHPLFWDNLALTYYKPK